MRETGACDVAVTEDADLIAYALKFKNYHGFGVLISALAGTVVA
jgi:hypothetical protein